jgi:hypothetical protein
MKRIPEIDDNARIVPLASGPGFDAVTIKRDPVEPVPVGTYVVMVFRVTGYDQDCDGSLMARLAQVDRHGEESGWEPTQIGLYPDSDLIVDDPDELWRTLDRGKST